MKKWLMAILFGTVLTLGACGGGGDNGGDNAGGNNGGDANNGGESVDAGAAEDIYKSNCASCHGGDLGGGMGPDLTSVGADHSKEDIIDIIHNGMGQMPAQKQVSDEDAETIASWLANKK
ncbi:Cytochrome c-551 [Lentibacillus sp. JNUCC-1]|uniref:cytochrome c551 n=1 Tax=Lentibacillus sp. JNUCC-1 TaxID=2654513 RepID=UPI0012E7E894|nr:cytochrome c [Lentibacillus sp. JNUCC-1]MUV39069.1 Cytochrome c-551 [Lentibacillus sp. JNUCC-1]